MLPSMWVHVLNSIPYHWGYLFLVHAKRFLKRGHAALFNLKPGLLVCRRPSAQSDHWLSAMRACSSAGLQPAFTMFDGEMMDRVDIDASHTSGPMHGCLFNCVFAFYLQRFRASRVLTKLLFSHSSDAGFMFAGRSANSLHAFFVFFSRDDERWAKICDGTLFKKYVLAQSADPVDQLTSSLDDLHIKGHERQVPPAIRPVPVILPVSAEGTEARHVQEQSASRRTDTDSAQGLFAFLTLSRFV